jgi:tRNA (guanine37-N1)-methyltransferase
MKKESKKRLKLLPQDEPLEKQKPRPLKFEILSLFPGYFAGPFSVSMLKKAQEKGLIEITLVDIRDFAMGKHRKVDDRPYGGGPGMVMMAPPIVKAIRSVKQKDSRVIYLSPQGKRLEASTCEALAKSSHLILLCGHYEGIDARCLKEVDEEISIGDYVLTSGCPAAAVFVDAVSRFIPGVLGHEEGALQDSFQGGKLEAPAYTRPDEFEGVFVPQVLKEGNHREIEKWRHSLSKDVRSKYEKCSD